MAENDPETQARLTGFRQGLERLGWSDGGNVRIHYRFAAASAEQARVLAKELVALQPDVILAHSTPISAALHRESRAIPIVFVGISDPVAAGFVASLPRPGGNLTGLMQFEASITGKWLALPVEQGPRARPSLLDLKVAPSRLYNSCTNSCTPHPVRLIPEKNPAKKVIALAKTGERNR